MSEYVVSTTRPSKGKIESIMTPEGAKAFLKSVEGYDNNIEKGDSVAYKCHLYVRYLIEHKKTIYKKDTFIHPTTVEDNTIVYFLEADAYHEYCSSERTLAEFFDQEEKEKEDIAALEAEENRFNTPQESEEDSPPVPPSHDDVEKPGYKARLKAWLSATAEWIKNSRRTLQQKISDVANYVITYLTSASSVQQVKSNLEAWIKVAAVTFAKDALYEHVVAPFATATANVLDLTGGLTALITTLYFAWKTSGIGRVPLLTSAAWIASKLMSTSLASDLISALSSWWSAEPSVSHELDVPVPGLAKALWAAVGSLAGAPCTRPSLEFIRDATTSMRLFTETGRFVHTICDLFSSAVRWIKESLLGYDSPNTIILKAREESAAFSSEAFSMLERLSEPDAKLSEEVANEIDELSKKGKALLERLSKLSVAYQDPTHTLPHLVKSVFAARNQLLALRASQTERPKPTAIWLVAPPGVGKSVSIELAVRYLNRDIYGNAYKTQADLVYQHKNRRFFDGYNAQKVLVWDDPFQKLDDETRATVGDTLIGLINSVPFLTEQSRAEEKASHFFSGDFVFITTNTIPKLPVDSPQAVFDRCYFFCLKFTGTEGANRDTKISPAGKRLHAPDPNCWHFQHIPRELVTSMSEKTVSKIPFDYPLTFATFVQFVKESYNKNQKMFKRAQKLHKELPALTVQPDMKFINHILHEGAASNSLFEDDLMSEVLEWPHDLLKRTVCKDDDEPCGLCDPDVHDAAHNLIAGTFSGEIGPPRQKLVRLLYRTALTCEPEDNLALTALARTFHITHAQGFIDSLAEMIVECKNNEAEKWSHSGNPTCPIGCSVTMRMIDVCVSSILGSMAASYGLTGDAFAWLKSSQPSSESESPGTTAKPVKNIPTLPTRSTIINTSYPIHEGDEESYKQILHKKILKNACNLTFIFADGKSTSGDGIFYEGQKIVTNLHFVRRRGSALTCVRVKTRGFDLKFHIRELVCAAQFETDLFFIDLNTTQLPQAKNIIKYFPTVAQVQRMPTTGLRLLEFDWVSAKPRNCNTIEVPRISWVSELSSGSPLEKGDLSHLKCVFRAPVAGRPGRCGKVYTVCNPKLPYSILGMHTAGHAALKQSYGVPITKEALLNAFGTPTHECILDQLTDEPSKTQAPPGARVIGTIPASMVVHQPARSSINRSLIHHLLPDTGVRPSALRGEFEGGTPLQKAAAKQFVDAQAFPDVPLLKRATSAIAASQRGTVEARVLTEFEILNGLADSTLLGPLDLSTSGGWKVSICENRQLHTHGKHALVETDSEGIKHLTEAGRRRVERAEKRLDTDTACSTFLLFLKDELRPIARVEAGETRGIYAPDFEHTYLMRKYFGSYLINVKANRLDWFCALGINPMCYAEWNCLFSTLIEPSRHLTRFYMGDFKSFDARTPKCLSDATAEVAKWFHMTYGTETPQERTRRASLQNANRNANLICGDVVYKQRPGSNNSGSFLTTVDNSVTVAIFMLYAIMKIARDKGRPVDEAQILRDWRLTTFGDDHILALPQHYDWLSMADIAVVAESLGMLYTDPQKRSVANIDCYNWTQLEFLKRTFTFGHDQLLRSPLPESVIRQIPAWVARSEPPERAVRENCAVALEYAAQHGPDFYRKLQSELNAALNEVGLEPLTCTFEFFEDRYFSGSFPIAHEMDPSVSDDMETTERKETETGLTTFGDDVGAPDPEAEITSVVSTYHRGFDPYQDQQLSTVLTREWRLPDITWSNTDASGTQLADYVLPEDLVNSAPFLKDKLRNFRYLQAGVKIRFQLAANLFVYGRAQISYLTSWSSQSQLKPAFSNVYQASCNNAHVLSAQTNIPVEITLPWVSPYTAVDAENPTETEGSVGRVVVHVLNPLTSASSDGPASLPIAVYASLVEARVAGPTYASTGPAVMHEMAKPNAKTPQSEGKQRSEKGMISNLAEAVVPVASAASSLPIVGGAASAVATGASIVGRVAGLFGLSKPSNLQVQQRLVMDTADNFSFGTGLDNANVLALDPENRVSNERSPYNELYDYSLFDNYKLRPALVRIMPWTESDVDGHVLSGVPVNPLLCHDETATQVSFWPTPLAAMSMLHAYWRGSLKYKLQVTAPRNCRARLRILWVPTTPTTYPSSISVSDMPLVNSYVLNIKGDVVYDFTVPYLQRTHYLEVGAMDSLTDTNSNGSILFVVENALNMTGPANTIYLNLWVAGGEDFEVARPCSWQLDGYVWDSLPALEKLPDPPEEIPEPESFEDYVARMGLGVAIRRLPAFELEGPLEIVDDALFEMATQSTDMVCSFRQVFEPLVQASFQSYGDVCMGERSVNWLNLGHRYTLFKSGTGTSIGVAPHSEYPSSTAANLVPQIFNLFVLHRGSVRFKVHAHGFTTDTTLTCRNYFAGEKNTSTGVGGMILLDTHARSMMETQMPFYSRYAMISVGQTQSCTDAPQMAFFAAESVSWDVYASFGDDVTLAWPRAPLPVWSA